MNAHNNTKTQQPVGLGLVQGWVEESGVVATAATHTTFCQRIVIDQVLTCLTSLCLDLPDLPNLSAC